MSKELQFRFDNITTPGGTSVTSSVVAFDKRTLYIGANWTIKLKELNKVNVVYRDQDDGGYTNDRRYNNNRFNNNGHQQQRRYGASHQPAATATVTLQGKGRSPFTCITNNATNDKFHNFIEALKQSHRKVKMKHDEKDPYAAPDNHQTTTRPGANILRAKITPTVSRSNQPTKQQSRGPIHMTPTKMKQSSGAFLSANHRTNTNYGATRGNVLQNNHTNNNQSSPSSLLHLPPKSPRNATPTKLRQHHSEEEEEELEFGKDGEGSRTTKSSSRVLFQDVVVKRDKKRVKMTKLQKKIEETMLGDRSDDDDEEDNNLEMNQMQKEEEEDEGEMLKEEKSVMSKMNKKKRLRRVKDQMNEESDGSDVEFDDVGTSSSTAGDVRKKLRLEEDADEDEEEEGENGSPSPAREEKVKENHASGKTITDEDTSRETSPVTTEDVVAGGAVENEDDDDDDLESGKVASTPEEKSSAKKGSGTILNFFQPLSAAPSKTTKSSTASTPVPPPSTPSKKKHGFNSHPSTPSPPSSQSYTWHSSSSTRVETTPLPMQRQANRWDNIGASATPKKAALFSPTIDSGAYYNHKKTPNGGYGSDDYEEEEVDDIYGNDDNENTAPPPSPPIRTTYHQQRRRKQVYGRQGGLGISRLGQARNPYTNKFRRGGTRPTSEADSALGLGRRNLGARTMNRDMSRRRLGPTVGTPKLFSGATLIEDQNDNTDEEQDDKPKIPGIQNLGNTCYLSASLQTLYSIPQFLHRLYQSYEELHNLKELPLTTALLEVAVTIGALKEVDVPLISPDVARSTLSTSKAANPSALKKQMDVLTEKFAGYEQRDAHEFLGDLVDFLHEELVNDPLEEKDDEAKKSEESDSQDSGATVEEKPATVVTTDLPTDEYFHLKVRVCLKCKSCGYSRSKEELYRHLSIDVGEDDQGECWGVERSLEHFFQAEDREVNCEKCKDGTFATQTMEIISRPKAILLHFKRFIVTQSDNGEMVLRKNKAKIPLKESLSISSFFSSEEEKPNGLYHLCGVVHHVGNTAFSGHYTTCAKRKLEKESVEEQWVFFDDTVGQRRTINYVTGNETNQKNCYMALYELK